MVHQLQRETVQFDEVAGYVPRRDLALAVGQFGVACHHTADQQDRTRRPVALTDNVGMAGDAAHLVDSAHQRLPFGLAQRIPQLEFPEQDGQVR